MWVQNCHPTGVRTELSTQGPTAGTQLDKLRGILKDSPHKYALRKEGLRLEETPALHVVHNPSVDPRVDLLVVERGEGEGGEWAGSSVGYHPGPNEGKSLKLDSNVIPLEGVQSWKDDTARRLHKADFRYVRAFFLQ